MTELADMAKLTCLVREGSITTFICDWNPVMGFLLKSEHMIYAFED